MDSALRRFSERSGIYNPSAVDFFTIGRSIRRWERYLAADFFPSRYRTDSEYYQSIIVQLGGKIRIIALNKRASNLHVVS